ncbi:MAG: hypothetical protein HXS44_00420 [Theionarchaea archaeon]|nr:hypothetical protein [Theionarchaea archaeon]
MKRTHLYTAMIILGIVVLAGGFIPLTRTVTATEERITQVTEYREETRTKEEPYIEEVVIGTEPREEVLLRDSIPVVRGSTLGKSFELTAGDVIIFEAHSDSDMMVSFSGQGEIYMTLEVGTDIEKEITIKKDGEHTLLYSSASVTTDIVIDFDIVRVYNAPIVEEVEKTRTTEYTEKIPYTVDVPVIEKVAQEETYTLGYFRYLGITVIIMGGGLFIWERQKKPKSKMKKKQKKKLKKR